MIEGRPLEKVIFDRQPLDIDPKWLAHMSDLALRFGVLDFGPDDRYRAGRRQHREKTIAFKFLRQIEQHLM